MQISASWSYDKGGVAASTFPTMEKAITAFYTSAMRIARRSPPHEGARVRQAAKNIICCVYHDAITPLWNGHSYCCEDDGLMLWLRPYR